jgi:ferric-dicitrate binding protein FerR (iron transport regulator)
MEEHNTDNQERRNILLELAADTLNVMEQTDTEAALRKVKIRMAPHRKLTLWQWTQRACAVLFIPLLTTIVLQQMHMYNLTTHETVTETTLTTHPGTTTSVLLSDGTKVFLNAESTLTYPVHFSGNTREVSLSGEGYFEVAKDAKHPFRVLTKQNITVEVLGTHFNVEAYPNDTLISTTLLEGAVNLLVENDKQQPLTYSMKPGEKISYHPHTGMLQCSHTAGAVETAWKDGKVICDNTPFGEVLRMLEKHYGVTFVLKDKTLLANSFTGTFAHQPLDEVMRYFAISSHIHWQRIDDSQQTGERSKILLWLE